MMLDPRTLQDIINSKERVEDLEEEAFSEEVEDLEQEDDDELIDPDDDAEWDRKWNPT